MVKTIIDIRILNACAGYLLYKINNSAKTAKEKGQIHGRKERLIVSITKQDIIGLLLKQNFCCSLTGIQFPMFNTQTGYKKACSINNINSLALPSADRIDSDGDYTLNNIEIVIAFYNMGKGNKSKQNAIEILNLIKNKTKKMSNLKQTQSVMRELLIIYAEEGRHDLAESYLSCNGYSIQISKTNSNDTHSKNKKRLADLKSRAFGIDILQASKLINLSKQFTNNKGYADNFRFAGSGIATKILNNTKIKLYVCDNVSKGVSYFMSKEDYRKLK
jgi:hypothetical protein